MQYSDVHSAVFLRRINRFVAEVELGGQREFCHVKNTGRLRELLLAGTPAYVQRAANPARKTRYDLIAVYKGDTLVNIDSQAPNRIFAEWVQHSDHFGALTGVKAEARYGSSRLDFLLHAPERQIYVEVKGVTLEQDGAAMFPDAPTLRGIRHIEELMRARAEGFGAAIAFIVKVPNARYFTPNAALHPDFAQALKRAAEQGVEVLALRCAVTPNSVTAQELIEVRLP